MSVITKGLMGEEDINKYDGTNTTFTRTTSVGGTSTLTPLGAGSSGLNFKKLLVSSIVSLSANPASTGTVNLADADSIAWRNHANSADVLLAKNSTDQLTFNSKVVSDGTHGNGLVIASGTATLTANAALGATTAQTAITATAAGALTTDAIEWSYASAPGAGDSMCIISPYVTSGNVNFVRANPTAGNLNVSAIVVNWRIVR